MINIRHAVHPDHAKSFDSSALRTHFLLEDLFKMGTIEHTYTMHDRMIVLGVVPLSDSIELPPFEALTKADFFLERREMGVINIGGPGTIKVDEEEYLLEPLECLYIGKGAQKVTFSSNDSGHPSEFYVNSLPAHAAYPTKKASKNEANQVSLGSKENCNERVIYQYIHEDGIESCQLVMGFTELKKGSIWNTFPPHIHLRRMEVYCYFDIPEDQLIMHFMGDPQETRHLVLRNKEAVISPEWSIHSGVGTSAYSFIWGMGGENKAFTDMDAVNLNDLK